VLEFLPAAWIAVEAVGAQDTAKRASAIGQEAEVICSS
jgi:hypothetical protein